MELRTTEQEMEEIRGIYRSLRDNGGDSTAWQKQLPPLTNESSAEAASGESTDPDSAAAVVSSVNGDRTDSAVATLKAFEDIKQRLDALQPRMEKFRKRLQQKDPVTDKPRYGARAEQRVLVLLERNEEMVTIMEQSFGGGGGDSGETGGSAIATIRKLAAEEEEETRRREEEERDRVRREEEAKRAAEEEALEEQRAAEEAERLRREQTRLELTRQAEQARRAVREAEEAASRADQEWVESIPNKGTPEGVRQQLNVLVESTDGDPAAQQKAIDALYTIFSQIVAHPEEPNFRRIRRDHPRFNEDIGRYPGGKELLIAAGFELGLVEEVPSFLSKEPNIEKDMDGWSAWFDLLKATLEILEQQMVKTK
jgi:hypothetical protein